MLGKWFKMETVEVVVGGEWLVVAGRGKCWEWRKWRVHSGWYWRVRGGMVKLVRTGRECLALSGKGGMMEMVKMAGF